MGRPSSYKPEYAEQALKLSQLGATDAELAEHFGIAESTLYSWKLEFPEFSEAIKNGKAPADAEIAAALYNRAKGSEWIEQQAIKVRVGQFEDRIEVVEVRRAVPPDTTACIFWLKNRRPDLWRDKTEQEHTGGVIVQVMKFAADNGPASE